MSASSCTPVINIWICKRCFFTHVIEIFVINSLAVKLSKSGFEVQVRGHLSILKIPNAFIETTVAALKRSKRKRIRNKCFVVFSSSVYWGAKIDHECECLIYHVFLDIKKDPKDWLSHISTWGSIYEKSLSNSWSDWHEIRSIAILLTLIERC